MSDSRISDDVQRRLQASDPGHSGLPKARDPVQGHHAAACRRPTRSRAATEAMAAPFADAGITHVVAIESRGFILGGPIAQRLGAGFIPVRKPGKLPALTRRETYDLEYGTDTLEIHADAWAPPARVLIVDDVLATGGTADATRRLVESLGAHVVGFSFLMSLSFLPGVVEAWRRRTSDPYSCFDFDATHAPTSQESYRPGSRRHRAVARLLGVLAPSVGRQMKPIGDTFVNLVKMVIAPVVFLTIVLGIANMHDLKKVGRVGGKALLYFEIVTTLALGDRARRRERAASRAKDWRRQRWRTADVSAYITQGKAMGFVDFATHVVPSSIVDAFAKGDVLQVVFVAVLFGVALAMLGDEARAVIASASKCCRACSSASSAS